MPATGAALVLICMSDAYKKSKNCKLEAEFAFKQDKERVFAVVETKYRPDGWLSALQGMSMYYDITDEKFDMRSDELVRQMRLKLQEKEVKACTPKRDTGPSGSAFKRNHRNSFFRFKGNQ